MMTRCGSGNLQKQCYTIMGYWQDDTIHQYNLSIDAQGGVYFGDQYAGQLAPENVATLRTFFEGGGFHAAKGFRQRRNVTQEHQVILSYGHEQVSIVSGETVSPEVQTILQLFADIHTQFYPKH